LSKKTKKSEWLKEKDRSRQVSPVTQTDSH